MQKSLLCPRSARELNESLVFEDNQVLGEVLPLSKENWIPAWKAMAKVAPLLPSSNQDSWCGGQHFLLRRYHVFIRGEYILRKNARIVWRDSAFRVATPPLHLEHYRWITFIMEEM